MGWLFSCLIIVVALESRVSFLLSMYSHWKKSGSAIALLSNVSRNESMYHKKFTTNFTEVYRVRLTVAFGNLMVGSMVWRSDSTSLYSWSVMFKYPDGEIGRTFSLTISHLNASRPVSFEVDAALVNFSGIKYL